MASTLYEQKQLDKALAKSAPNVVTTSFGLQKVLPRQVLQTGVVDHKRQLAANNRLLKLSIDRRYWSKVKSRTQGSRPRPRTQKNFEAKDQGHRRKYSPKKVFKNFFQAKNVLKKIFLGDLYLRKPKKGLCRFSARFLAFSNEISTVQK